MADDPADDHGHRDVYNRSAQAWHRDRSDGQAEQIWLDHLTDGLQPGARILDLGCGTGRPVAARLLPGGRLIFTSGTTEGEVWGAVSGGPVWHASLTPGGYLAVLEPAGMTLRRFVAEDPKMMGRTIWLLQRR